MVVVDAEDKQTINEKTFRVNDPPTGKREVLELDIESFPPDIKMYYVFLQFRAFVENSRIYAFSLSPGCFHRVPVLDMDRFKETNSILALVLLSAFVAIAVILLGKAHP
ncbi:uncharacterized protein LOC133196826 [Saccostrea echinata]|uniref:uncharacterized protein LOC133196826 n=1 Tax=Saccostrea echinata TaxID=191078 RepID=UPI002A809582|nr:uncharacterized protein LOC133196826 [Saccostrea echinata]